MQISARYDKVLKKLTKLSFFETKAGLFVDNYAIKSSEKTNWVSILILFLLHESVIKKGGKPTSLRTAKKYELPIRSEHSYFQVGTLRNLEPKP